MLREPYSTKSYSNNSNNIDNRLALRPPQKESLERLARIVDILSLDKFGALKKAFSDEKMSMPEPDLLNPESVEKAKAEHERLVAKLSASYEPVCADDLVEIRNIGLHSQVLNAVFRLFALP